MKKFNLSWRIYVPYLGSEAFSLILKDRDSERYIPVIIGISEARAILIELKQTKTQRPLTHELFLTLADNFSCSLLEGNIIYYEEGVFFADLVMRRVDGSLFHLDARPSDAIALALKANVPFFMNEDIFNDNCLCDQLRTECSELEPDDPFEPVKLQDLSIHELKELLHDAVKCEDFELAAQVKEELDKRENRTDSVATNQKQQFQWDFVVLQRNQQNTTDR